MQQRANGNGKLTSLEMQELEKRLKRAGHPLQDKATLARIAKAKNKIKEGTYGVCEACSSDIGIKRLMALPDAERCRPCQANYEDHEEGGLSQRRTPWLTP